MTKSELRAWARARLASLSVEDRESAETEIARRVWTVPEIAGARTLLLFASLPAEVHTDAIAAEARRRGIVVTYPRCLPETREMRLHSVSAVDELRTGAYGIREPDALLCPVVETSEIDAALVPGLAWDRAGGRLGRGAGYYDRLLASPAWRGAVVGLFFAAQEAPSVPADPWDVPLDAAVTDREVWRRV